MKMSSTIVILRGVLLPTNLCDEVLFPEHLVAQAAADWLSLDSRSILMKTTPSSRSKLRASRSRGYIIESQSE